MIGPGREPPRDVGLLGRRGQHHDLGLGEPGIAPQSRAHLEPADVGQLDVEEDQLRPHRLGVSERRLAIVGIDDGNALVFEREADEVDHVRLVVGDQDR